jgi:hypothetical protein
MRAAAVKRCVCKYGYLYIFVYTDIYAIIEEAFNSIIITYCSYKHNLTYIYKFIYVYIYIYIYIYMYTHNY